MELSKEQVQQLFAFTEKKRVYWYDLQLELVDHLASGIEEEMTKDPSLSFDQALQRTYTDFGIFGFAKVVQEKAAQVQKASRKMWWKEFYTLFTWPKAAFVIMCLAITWQLCMYINQDIMMLVCLLFFMASKIYTWVYTRKQKSSRKLMLLQFSAVHFTMLPMVYQGFLWSNHGIVPVIVIVLSILGIMAEVTAVTLYKKIKRQAVHLYPEAFTTT